MIKQLSNRFSAAICVMLIFAVAVVPAFAQSDYSSAYAVTDDAAYFSSTEFDDLCSKAENAGTKAGFQIIIHTSTDGIDSSEMDTYYNQYHDSDSAYQPDGVMLVFDTKSDNRIILTYGAAEAYFDDNRMSELQSSLKPDLSTGDYYNASKTFIDKTLEYYDSGVPADGSYSNVITTDSNEPKILTSLKKYGWIGGIAGVVIAIIFVLVNVGRYKYNGRGGTYDLNKNSQMTLIDTQDVFVSKHTTYVTIQSSSGSSGGSSSGGSSSHGSSGSF